MADPNAESSRMQRFSRRRGWQLPAGSSLPPGTDGPSPDPPDAVSQGRGQPEGDRPQSVLANSVAGQARNVAVGSVQGPGGSAAVVTFRLEQYDPNAGRTGLVTVRMLGNQAMGFATEGDWVEVNGKSKRGFLDVEAAFNHTSGAQYRRPVGCFGAAMVLVILSGILILLIADVGSTSMFGAMFAWRP